MQEVFVNALYHEEPVVLRRRLLPLSLGHIYILLAVDSPYVLGGECSLFDLAFAVGVCTRTWEAGQEWLRSPRVFKDAEKWGGKCRGMDMEAENKTFAAYMDDYTKMPERWEPKSDGKGSNSAQHPWPLIIATKLKDSVGESRAWNMCLPMALAYWSAAAELMGDKSLVSDADYEAIKQLEAEAAERKQEKVA